MNKHKGPPLSKEAKIFVAGHRGLVGSALVRVLRQQGYGSLLLKTRAECDLENSDDVRKLFETEKPDVVLLAAAKVGGILANQNLPYDFIAQNLRIELNVIEEAHRHGVKHLFFLGSSCIYPKMAAQPIAESSLLTGPLEPTNRAYALAKIAGIELCWSLNRQHGRRYLCLMPSNLYGIEDNFDLKTSHVLPALIRKVVDADQKTSPAVEVWGTGSPRREFLFNDDLARAVVFLLEQPSDNLNFLFNETEPPLLNVGAGIDVTIKELADTVKRAVGYEGSLVFNPNYPDGTPRKLLDVSRMKAIGWQPEISLEDGVSRVVAHIKSAAPCDL